MAVATSYALAVAPPSGVYSRRRPKFLLLAWRQGGCALRLPPIPMSPRRSRSHAPTSPATAPAVTEQRFAIHGQFTYVEQQVRGFNAPYAGPNSLTPDRAKETTDFTLYFGARLWQGAEIWISPEIDQGFGLNDTLGVAGFPSGEAYKVGANYPYLRWLACLRAPGSSTPADEREAVEGVANQLGGSRSLDRWVFTVGKFSVTDIFDTNQYAHDPRNDFLNWAAVDSGSFDYAADAWGFTVGAAAERYQGSLDLPRRRFRPIEHSQQHPPRSRLP